MRFYIKKQLIQSCKFLSEVHKKIKGNLNEIDVNLLVECQQIAVNVGKNILEEDGFEDVVSVLEQYCELVYQVNDEKVDKTTKKNILKNMDLFIYNTKNCIKSIPDKYEILFLPYKASMWDSMESIWISASQDTSYNVKVMPIPYIEKDDNGGNGIVKWEGDQLPHYVEITSFLNYEIEKYHPEIIIIHNPCDEYNTVASVLPKYYSYELKKNTEILAYVPYYVTGGSQADSFYNLPSYEHIDFIFTQNDNFKEYFHKDFNKKLVPLGSPKIDKIVGDNLKLETIGKTLKNTDKKVILYNTSISSLLQEREKSIDKMKYVFDCFKDRRDVELVWRPHPLTEATINSMAKELELKYKNLKDMFLNENIGILDKSSDVTKAVKSADAYIGEDTSSLVHLFGVQGKPIFLLENKLSSSSNQIMENNLCFSDFIKIDKKLWFVHNFLPALFTYDIENQKLEFVKQLPFESGNTVRSYCEIIKYKEKLILIPMSSSEICVYNIKTKEISTQEIKQAKYCNFMRGITYSNKLFMIPTAYDAIVEFDMEQEYLKYHSKCITKLKKLTGYDGGYNFMYGVVEMENKLYLSSVQSNYILEFDMDNGKYMIHEVGYKGHTYWDMVFDGKYFWLNPFKGKDIVRWNKETNESKVYNSYPEDFNGDSECFLRFIDFDEKIIAVPKTSNMFISIDKKSGKLEQINLDLPEVKNENIFWGSNYYFAKKEGKTKLYTMSAYDNKLMLIDVEKNSCEVIGIGNIDNETIRNFMKQGFSKHGENLPYAIRESNIFTLDIFADYLHKNKHSAENQIREYSKVINNIDGTCGEKIFCFLDKALEREIQKI
ncbi:hypothetical protein [Paraclostridium bifermentans]|uniref:hypothetical protein n=1 Tax=Paraclostridium bifermentans TaxID=1490 RepID=UPI0024BAF997|nr:hypothetical protein [Paraclostridium bifermentans]